MSPLDLDALAALVPDGASLALPPDNSLPPSALARALVRAGKRNLNLIGVPVSGYASDLLIGAGCVVSIQTSGVTLGEAGMAPRFTAALAAGTIRVIDATCPAMHTMLQATEKGVPFMPLRGVIGSDILAHRPDWKVIDNPFADGGDPIVLLPALSPDVAIFHAAMADADGNVYVGRRRELATIAHLSLSQFERRFKALFQVTPVQYLIRLRLNKAGQLLTSSTAKITDIASQCGFYDHSHFIRQFTRAYGLSPSAYRQQHQ